MADVAGLVIGIATLWRSCVQVYEIVDSTRQHGVESELLSVKYEVERVRLLCWGDAVGLGYMQRDAQEPAIQSVSPLDVRLYREDVRSAVLALLGCIQDVFNNADRLQLRYGLTQNASSLNTGMGQGILSSQSQRILNGVFKRACDNFRGTARERQSGTPLTRKTVWAVRDRKRFGELVTELRGFNDSLESLFPDAQLRIAETMNADIDAAVQVRQLQLLQEATAGEHRDISERSSQRLDALGASVSSRNDLFSDQDSDLNSQITAVRPERKNSPWENASEVLAPDNPNDLEQEMGSDIDKLSKKLREFQLYIDRKMIGAVSVRLKGPSHSSHSVSGSAVWEGPERDQYRRAINFPVDEGNRGFLPTSHAAFEMYKKKKFLQQRSVTKSESPGMEDRVLLDPESHPNFEHVIPGTVTVEGYGLECWDFERSRPTYKDEAVAADYREMPAVTSQKLFRKVAELQGDPKRVVLNSVEDELDLREVTGTPNSTYHGNPHAKDLTNQTIDLLYLLNRDDPGFIDFRAATSVSWQWGVDITDPGLSIAILMRQIILSKELQARLQRLERGVESAGFTERVLTTLIISELWLRHVKIVWVNNLMETNNDQRPKTGGQTSKAESFKKKGNEALSKSNFKDAIELYSEAINTDPTNAVYLCNRSAAQFALGDYRAAEIDAHSSIMLDPNYAKAWSRLGMATLEIGYGTTAQKMYRQAIDIAGDKATHQMRQGLVKAEEKFRASVKIIESEKNVEKRHKLRSELLDEEWEAMFESPAFNSVIHEQQVEGLLLFAQRMRWPYMNELRECAEDLYSDYQGGGTIDVNVIDWLYGLTLPGKWFAAKIMTALVFCTPGIAAKAGIAAHFHQGLWLRERTYWRQRTVLGRVLGCLPGVISLCGWVGPCPPIELEGPVDKQRPRHVTVIARQLSPMTHNRSLEEIASSPYSPYCTLYTEGKELEPILAEMKESSKWIIPEPPVQDVGSYQIDSVCLTRVTPREDATPRIPKQVPKGQDSERNAEYRASIAFTSDNNDSPITYKLFTNPVFASPPGCYPDFKDSHEVHMKALWLYQNIWPIDRLKEHTAEDSDREEIMVINATGEGGEVVARAWCSERGKCAVIRRKGGPCFVCATRAASKDGLGNGVLIWVG